MSNQLVLFVDDEDKILRAWRRSFMNEPYNMLFAKSAEDALKIMQGLKISVIVSDYSMPEVDGLQLLYKVKELYPSTVRILVSGQATLEVASAAINRCAINKIFQKPCNTIELGLSIRDGIKLNSNSTQLWDDPDLLYELEKKHPGITQVKRDKHGFIKLLMNES